MWRRPLSPAGACIEIDRFRFTTAARIENELASNYDTVTIPIRSFDTGEGL